MMVVKLGIKTISVYVCVTAGRFLSWSPWYGSNEAQK